MASFCTNCGAPVGGQFCTGCGTAVQSGAPPAPATSPAAAPAGGSAVKVILIVVGVFVLLGAMSVGGLVYAGYRAKKKFAELRREYAGTTETASRSGRSAEAMRTFAPSKGSGCRVLEGQEAAGILGAAVDRVESTPAGSDGSEECRYWMSAAERQRVMRAEIASGISEVGKGDNTSTAGFEKVIGGALSAVIEANGDNKNTDYAFMVQVSRRNGRAMWNRMESANTAAKELTGGVDLAEMATRAVDGVGDRAMVLAAGNSIMVLKGDVFFMISFHQFAPGREKAVGLARAVAGRV